MKEYLFIGGYYDGRRERVPGQAFFKIPIPSDVPLTPDSEIRGVGVHVETYTLRSFSGLGRKCIEFYAIPKLTDYDCLVWLVARYPLSQPKIK